MKQVISNILLFISSVGVNILFFIGSLIHLWTIIVAYMESGFVGATITFFLPVISQIYWFFISIKISGEFINTYSVIIIAYTIAWIIFLGAGALSLSFEGDKHNE